jgi:hypothetical protein
MIITANGCRQLFLYIVLLSILGLVVGIFIVELCDYGTVKKIGDVVKGYIYGDSPACSSGLNPCCRGNPCERAIRLSDHTCQYRQRFNGENCTSDDVCYLQPPTNQSSLYPKYCCDGRCVSSRSRCLGICPTNGLQFNNASTCSYALFPINYAQFQSINLTCIYGACTVVAIQRYPRARPLTDQDVFNTSSCPLTLNTLFSKCIVYECFSTDTETNCVFRYKCATFDLGNNMLDSHGGGGANDLDETITFIQNGHNNVKNNGKQMMMPTFGDNIPVQQYSVLNREYQAYMSYFVQ